MKIAFILIKPTIMSVKFVSKILSFSISMTSWRLKIVKTHLKTRLRTVNMIEQIQKNMKQQKHNMLRDSLKCKTRSEKGRKAVMKFNLQSFHFQRFITKGMKTVKQARPFQNFRTLTLRENLHNSNTQWSFSEA